MDLFKRLPHYDAGIAYVLYRGQSALFAKDPSLKSLEFAVAGIPVIASATNGHMAYQKEHGFNFQLFTNNPDDFANAIAMLDQKQGLTTIVMDNINAIKAFDWQHIVDTKLLPLYEHLAELKSH